MIDRLKKRAAELERAHAESEANWCLAVMPARLTDVQQAAWHASEVEPLEQVGERISVLRLVAGSDRSSGWLQ